MDKWIHPIRIGCQQAVRASTYFAFCSNPVSCGCPDALHVTLTPKKLKTGIGSTVILSCALMGSPEFSIRWYRNTELLRPDEAVSIRGLSNETLLIASAQKSHSGAYQCFATRKAQTAQDFAIIVLEGELDSRGGLGTFRSLPGDAPSHYSPSPADNLGNTRGDLSGWPHQVGASLLASSGQSGELGWLVG